MIEKFLKAKHWQLFLLGFVIPVLMQFLFMGIMMFTVFTNVEQNPEILTYFFPLILIISLLFMLVLYGWFWSIAVGLDRFIPDDLKLNVKRFKIFLIIPIVYILLFSVLVGVGISGMIDSGEPINPVYMVLILPLHLFSMFCMIYCLYFVAKTIKTAELKKKVRFGEFAGEFVLLWFFPIGIWIIQPRINKLVEEESDDLAKILHSDELV